MASVEVPTEVVVCQNWVGGEWSAGSGASIEVYSPINGTKIGTLAESSMADVERAVKLAPDSPAGKAAADNLSRLPQAAPAG